MSTGRFPGRARPGRDRRLGRATPAADRVLDCLEPGEVAVVDLTRPDLGVGEGLFLVAFTSGSTAGLVAYCAHVDPLTRRGKLRREVRAGAIRFAADDLGETWWLWRVRYTMRDVP